MPFFRSALFSFLLCMPFVLFSQKDNKGVVYGKVSDDRRKALELVNVAVRGTSGGVVTDSKGNYRIVLPSDTTLRVTFSFIGYAPEEISIKLRTGESKNVNVMLLSTIATLPTAQIIEQRVDATRLTRLDPKQATHVPSMSNGIEDLLKTLPGVSSNNELSSQYTVRGGNFDENLIYVNGIEIYRPFLISSGQQEGLSFINSQMVSNIEFSSGGFAAEYGDKLSSVLDITYRRPQETAASVALSLLGADVSFEGRTFKDKFTYLVGARYKTSQHLLKALETKGEYNPSFGDVQALLTYTFNPKWELSSLLYYSRNRYKIVPESRQTDFGTFQESYRLNIYFDGQEIDDYETTMGALTLDFNPNNHLKLRLITSAYSAIESETYDIQSQYWLGKRETSSGSEQYGDVVQVQGVGTFIDHARNYFEAQVFNIGHNGTYVYNDHVLKWGARYQHQFVDDKLSEWELVDSAGYLLPHPADFIGSTQTSQADLVLNNVARSANQLRLNNFDAFVQNSWTFSDKKEGEYVLSLGVRANYWDYNSEINVSPRGGIAYKPNWKQDVVWRLSGGVYSQAPFYREMRLFDGNLYEDAKSQRSYQVVLGNDYKFTAWNRPFIFTSEVYYKYLENVIPYEVDNVRIRYYADQQAKGYAAGLDLRINGEFVKGIDSWASLSLMQTEEDVKGDSYMYYVNSDGDRITASTVNNVVADSVTVFPGMIPRPSDQRLNFSIFFQDYLPWSPTFKVHLRGVFGTKLPFGTPNSERYQQTLRMPSYRRVDIGFSKQLISEDSRFQKNNPLRYVKNMWITLEIFNLLDVNNTISYTWVKDVSNSQYAVPNHLTSRQINVKLVMEF
ncbi:MAG: TonB-dependent receptor [Lentimicrobiaceae bacterium]|jgi:hypothetical protein|nr:TonB-dependent receptor [Lentimicrobiaceae bacterium]